LEVQEILNTTTDAKGQKNIILRSSRYSKPLDQKEKTEGEHQEYTTGCKIRLLRKPTKTPEIHKNTKRQSNIGKA
jgi:hypothetical protein